MTIYEHKFILRGALVFLHYDGKNQDVHLDVRLPRYSLRNGILRDMGTWVLKDSKSKHFIDVCVLLKDDTKRNK